MVFGFLFKFLIVVAVVVVVIIVVVVVLIVVVIVGIATVIVVVFLIFWAFWAFWAFSAFSAFWVFLVFFSPFSTHPNHNTQFFYFFFISFLPFLFTTHFSIRRLSSNTMLPHLNESRLKGSYYTSTSLASSTRSNINQNADNALRILNDSDKLMADPKQTATALLAVKYGIFESADTNLSYNLMALSKLLSDHPSAWNVVDQSLIDKVSSLSLLQSCFLTNVTNTHYLR